MRCSACRWSESGAAPPSTSVRVSWRESSREASVRREAVSLKTTLRATWSPPAFVGKSPAVREVLDIVVRLAGTDAPVLLT